MTHVWPVIYLRLENLESGYPQGPEDTPYHTGVFIFDMYFPPQVRHQTLTRPCLLAHLQTLVSLVSMVNARL